MSAAKNSTFFIIAVLFSAMLYAASTSMTYNNYESMRLFAYIAPVPVLLYVLYASRRWSIFAALLVGCLHTLVSVYLYAYGALPYFIVLISVGLSTITFTLAVLFSRYVIQKSRHCLSVFAFPSAWCVLDFFQTFIPAEKIPNTLLAISQFAYKPIIQIASITGIWGIIFLLNLVASSIVVAFWNRKNLKTAVMSLLVPAVIVIVSIAYGVWYMQHSNSTELLKVGLAAHDPKIFNPILENSDEGSSQNAVQNYIARENYLAKAGAQYTLQTEVSLLINQQNNVAVMSALKAVSAQNHIYTFNPVALLGQPEERNALIAINPQGNIVAQYYKMHLVRGLESTLTPGNSYAWIPNLTLKIGMAICHDMDFINPSAHYGSQGTQILFVPAVDFDSNIDGWAHARMAMLQGVANGFSVARAALQGYLTVSDSHGRLLGKAMTKKGKDVYLVASVPAGTGNTFYSRYVYWFPTFNIFLVLLLWGFALRTRK